MPRVTDPYERQHLANLAKYGKLIDEIFRSATQEAAQIGAMVGTSNFDASRVFSFNDYPLTQRRVQSLLSRLANNVETAIVNGIEAEWTLANNKNSALSRRVFGDNVGRLTQAQYRRYFSTNDDARQAFLQRKEQGLNLSERVWRYAQSFKDDIELGLDVGIRTGLDASAMSRQLQQFLQHPDMLFRRVRDEHGNLVLSKRASDFHPGQGVYRSSYKNARRLAVTETNIAYRTADYERIQQLDFVVGIEVCLSNNHPIHDICDDLCGRYPKDFKFELWHPHCRCYVVSILKTEKELAEENAAILRGEEPTEYSVNQISDVPDNFKRWIGDNANRIYNARSIPYFIQDNMQRVSRVLYENATHLATQAREALKSITIEDLEKEFTITGKEYMSKSTLMQFDLLGLKAKIREIGLQNDFDVDIAKINIFENGHWEFTICSRKQEIYQALNNKKYPSFVLKRMFGEYLNEPECHHALMMLAERLQGKGIGKDLFKMMYKSYQRMGVRYLTVDANINVGGYAWLKYGFYARGEMEAHAAVEGNKLAHDIITQWYKSNNATPKTWFPMYILRDKLGATECKNTLLGNSWRGVIDLQNKEQIDIWEHYLGIK